jgi:16S rRNA (guanine966-N2)-methyltransferase
MGTSKRKGPARERAGDEAVPPVGVRIIGGKFRGRKLEYSGDPRTRPMKDRVREALFNLLGTAVRGKHAIDLFAGTGALGLEALSRGAVRATLVERHFPTAGAIRRNAKTLGVEEQVEVVAANTFLWFRRRPELGADPWLVFSSPPYAFYTERSGEMLELLEGIARAMPVQSVMVVEADERFDFGRLPYPAEWRVRAYPPAVVGIYHKVESDHGHPEHQPSAGLHDQGRL